MSPRSSAPADPCKDPKLLDRAGIGSQACACLLLIVPLTAYCNLSAAAAKGISRSCNNLLPVDSQLPTPVPVHQFP